MLKLAQMVQQGKMHNTFGSIKLNANGSIAQTAQVPFSENSSSVVGWHWKEIRGWTEKAFYKQLKVFIKNLGEDPENWVG